MRVVFDTDVIIAATRSIKGASRAWLEASLIKEVQLVLSVPMAVEYEAILKRPIQLEVSGMTVADVDLLVNMLCEVALRVDRYYFWRPSIVDPNDEMVLETAIHGQVDALLTFNESDYRGAERFGIKIMRPGLAWRQWKEGALP